MNTDPTRRTFLKKTSGLLLGGIINPVYCGSGSRRTQRITVSQFQMSMLVKITVYADHREQGERRCREAFGEMHRLVRIFSCFDQTSELRRLCARAGQGPIQVSDALFEVLSYARTLAGHSQGAFDPTVGPMSRLWRQARCNGTPPQAREIERAMSLCGYQNLVVNSSDQTVELLQPNMTLDLGGLAKGYIGDLTIRYLRRQGLSSAAYEAGGDIVVSDAPPHSDGWGINVPGQAHPLIVRNQAVSISGDRHQYLDYQGTRYSHVIDPRSGQALVDSQPSIYKASNGLMADAKATLQSIT